MLDNLYTFIQYLILIRWKARNDNFQCNRSICALNRPQKKESQSLTLVPSCRLRFFLFVLICSIFHPFNSNLRSVAIWQHRFFLPDQVNSSSFFFFKIITRIFDDNTKTLSEFQMLPYGNAAQIRELLICGFDFNIFHISYNMLLGCSCILPPVFLVYVYCV